MIFDLDGVPNEPRPTWRERWLRPLAAASLLAAVLLVSFVHLDPARPTVLTNAAPAPDLRTRVLPPTVARLVTRTPFSGVTGLTPAALNDGFRDVYRLPDGRTFTVTGIPDDGAVPARLPPGTVVRVSGPMLYLVGSGDVTPGELTELADRLR
jgi:hypothetical protein